MSAHFPDSTRASDHTQTLPDQRDAVKDYFPIFCISLSHSPSTAFPLAAPAKIPHEPCVCHHGAICLRDGLTADIPGLVANGRSGRTAEIQGAEGFPAFWRSTPGFDRRLTVVEMHLVNFVTRSIIVGHLAKVQTNTLDSPIFASSIPLLNWNSEWETVFAAPPLCSIQWTLTFQWNATPSSEFCLPLRTRKEAISDQGSVTIRYVFF